MKNYIFPIIAGLFVLIAVPVTVYLAANPNIVADIRNRASSSTTGVAGVSLSPATGSVAVGQTLPVAIMIDPSTLTGATLNGISTMAVVLHYTYSGTTPELQVQGGRLVDGDIPSSVMSVTQNSVQESAGSVNIYYSLGAMGSASPGYKPTGPFKVATINFVANAAVSGLTVNFDPGSSKIFLKGGVDDVLLVPSSNGVYTVTGAATTKYKCVSNACVVDATGTFDTIAACNATCTAAVTTYKCVNNACVLDATGTYATQAACTAACTAATTHLACVSNSCVTIAGAGSNTGGCTVENATCGSSGQNNHLECRNNTCVRISGASNDTGGCSVEGRGCLYQHKTCVSNACVTQYCSPDSSPCADNCVSNANCGSSVQTPNLGVSTPTPTPVAQKTLPVTGTVENTAVILFGGTLLLFLARTLLAF